MCLGGSKPSTNTWQSQVQTSSPNAAPYAQGALAMAETAAQTPFTPWSGPNVQAGLTPEQLSAISGAQGQLPTFGAAQQLALGATGVTPNDIAQYFNPYQQNVIGATQAQFDLANQMGINAVRGNAAAQNALGGTGEDRAKAMYLAGVQPAQNAQIAGLEQSGWNNAYQQAQQAQAQRLAASTGLAGEAAQGIQGQQGLMGLASTAQQTQTQQNQFNYQQYLRQMGYPLEVAQYLTSQIASLTPSLGGTQTNVSYGTQTPAQPSLLGQLAGVGAIGASLWPGSGSSSSKRGGRIARKRQSGGSSGSSGSLTDADALGLGAASYVPHGTGAPNAGVQFAPMQPLEFAKTPPPSVGGVPLSDLGNMAKLGSKLKGSSLGSSLSDSLSGLGNDISGGLSNFGTYLGSLGGDAAGAAAGGSEIADLLPFLALAQSGGRIEERDPDSFDSRWGGFDTHTRPEGRGDYERMHSFDRPMPFWAYPGGIRQAQEGGAIEDHEHDADAPDAPSSELTEGLAPRAEPIRAARSSSASVRNNNPGAMWPGPSSKRFGATGSQSIAGGNKIATFPDAESGAAAQFDLLYRNYRGMRLGDAIAKWSNAPRGEASEYTRGVSKASGLGPNDILTRDILLGPQGIDIARAMARVESGGEYPLSPHQWSNAQARVREGVPNEGVPNEGVPNPTFASDPASGDSDMRLGFAGDGTRHERDSSSLFSSPGLFGMSPRAREALLAAGLGMLGSGSPYPGVAIGQGGLRGLAFMEASRHNEEQQRMREEALQARESAARNLDLWRERTATEKERADRANEQIKQQNADIRKELTDLKSKGGEPLGDYSLAGDEYLNSIDPQWRDTVKGLYTYEQRPSELSRLGTGQKNALMNATLHYAHSKGEEWRSTEANEISDSVKTFNRAHGDSVTAFNRALAHAKQLEDLYVALKNHDPTTGTLLKALATAVGRPDYTDVDALANLVGGEFTKAVVGNMSVGKEREDTRRFLESQRGMEQQIGALNKYRNAASAQLIELKRMFLATTHGKVDFDNRLSPHAIAFARTSPEWIEGRGETGMVGERGANAPAAPAPAAPSLPPITETRTVKDKEGKPVTLYKRGNDWYSQ